MVDLVLHTLAAHTDRIVPAVGREARGYPAHEVNVVVGKKLGRDVIELPSGHVGSMTHPAEFGRRVAAGPGTELSETSTPEPTAGAECSTRSWLVIPRSPFIIASEASAFTERGT